MKNKTLYISIVYLLFLFLAINQEGQSQLMFPIKIKWKTLKDVKFTEKFNKEYDATFLYPTFGANIKKLEGKIVELTGYAIPIEQNYYVLSAAPMASCFFCGAAGPESIVQLNFIKKTRLKTDQIITVQGTLKLNPDNIDDLNYIFDQAIIVQKTEN